MRHVGQELGVRYLLERSIRRVNNRVRITAQLIDVRTGTHRWAENYDRKWARVFSVQDEITRTIAAILVAHVTRAEVERALLKPPAMWQAYDYYLRGSDAFAAYLRGRELELVYEGRRLLQRSLEIDPSYARAYALLSDTHALTYVEPLDDDYLSPVGLA